MLTRVEIGKNNNYYLYYDNREDVIKTSFDEVFKKSGKYYKDFYKYLSEGGKILPSLEVKVSKKKRVLKRDKDLYLADPIQVTKDIFLFTDEEHRNLYDLAYNICLDENKEFIEVLGTDREGKKESFVQVSKKDLEHYFKLYRKIKFEAEMLYKKACVLLDNTKSADDLDSINWTYLLNKYTKIKSLN